MATLLFIFLACWVIWAYLESANKQKQAEAKRAEAKRARDDQELKSLEEFYGRRFPSLHEARTHHASNERFRRFSAGYDSQASAEDKRDHAVSSGDDTINWRAVMERGRWHCALCNTRIPRKTRDEDNRGTIDHIVPISRGGRHEWDNVQAAHWRCNRKKSTKHVSDWDASPKPNGKTRQLRPKLRPSSTLAAVIGRGEFKRSEVTSRLWAYIRQHDLQDATHRQRIHCDSAMQKVFLTKTISLAQMEQAVSKHLSEVR